MEKGAESTNAHAESFHVRDCYVWAEIYYLDSPTDYREYLPRTGSLRNPPKPVPTDDLVFLDSGRSRSGAFVFLITILVCTSLAAYLLYLLIESF